MATAEKRRYTPEEYLALERRSEIRHEYYAGEIFAMGGASERHVLIVTNLCLRLGLQLIGRPCKVYSNDMRLKVSPTGLYTYPDVMALCGEARFDDERRDTLLNPSVIIEVLSESTEAYDRGKKFDHYRKVESCTDYVLISQDAHHIEHYSRQPDGRWLLSVADGPEGVISLTSMGCELKLAEVYDKVQM